MPKGLLPTGMAAPAVLVAMSMGVTEAPLLLVT
jgi:hypothetical protein